MKNLKAVLLLSVLSLISVLTVGYGGFSLAFYALPYESEEGAPPSSSVSAVISSKEEKTESKTESPKPESEKASSAATSSSVAVNENHTVSGKITQKYIAPATASLKYNNVYIKNNSGAKIDIKAELGTAIKFKIAKNTEPQVLILHTHATESYMQENRDYYTKEDASRSTDLSKNMAAIGERVAAELTAVGIKVIHDKTLHDYPSYTGSYTAAAKTIKAYLKKYPSIKVVLDVHRDAVSGEGSEKIKLVREIGGKDAAQVMLVMGSQTGNITGFPEWKQNLRLAMRFHQKMETMYPGLARPILLASKKYNESLTTGSMLLEVGTDANWMEEALYSGTLAGKALAETLLELK